MTLLVEKQAGGVSSEDTLGYLRSLLEAITDTATDLSSEMTRCGVLRILTQKAAGEEMTNFVTQLTNNGCADAFEFVKNLEARGASLSLEQQTIIEECISKMRCVIYKLGDLQRSIRQINDELEAALLTKMKES